MEAERKRVANELRSLGFAEAEKIRADADKQREVIIAEAYRDAQRIKGEGDAKAAAIYAKAFEQNPEFYAFYRSLEAYRQSFTRQERRHGAGPQFGFLQVSEESVGPPLAPARRRLAGTRAGGADGEQPVDGVRSDARARGGAAVSGAAGLARRLPPRHSR